MCDNGFCYGSRRGTENAIQNKSYSFGDTNSNPIIMVNRNDYGGLSGSLKLFIDDIIYDLIPEDEE